MPKAVSTVNPAPRDTIKEHRSLASVKEITYPFAPFVREATATEDVIKAVPIHAVKSLVKIELENDSWGVAAMAAVKEISSISKIVSDASAKDKARLITTNERRD